jgi:coenzyme PQQ precursor peptide PqqA
MVGATERAMTWTKPTFVEVRYGFEITMYVQNR